MCLIPCVDIRICECVLGAAGAGLRGRGRQPPGHPGRHRGGEPRGEDRDPGTRCLCVDLDKMHVFNILYVCNIYCLKRFINQIHDIE